MQLLALMGVRGILDILLILQTEHLYVAARSGSTNWELGILLGSVPIRISLTVPRSFLFGVLVTISGDVSGNGLFEVGFELELLLGSVERIE